MRWGKVALADQEWRNWCGNTTGMTKILAPGSWKWMPSCEQCSSLRAFGASSNACWSSSQRWTHNGQKLPLLLSKRPLHFWNWEPSQPSKVVQAITVGLALLKTKDTDQSLCQHNFTAALWWNYGPWNALWGLERLATTHKRFQTKQEQCSHDRDPAHCLRWKKVDCHFLLVLMRREEAVFCCLMFFYTRTLQQKIWDNKAMSENCPRQTLLLPLYCLLPAVPAQEVLLWSWVNHHCPNRNYWSHGSTERKKFMLLLI